MNGGGESAEPAAATANFDLEVVRTFLDQGRYLAGWLRDGGDRLENKAGTVLSAAGVLLPLMALVVAPIGRVRGGWSAILVTLAIGASIAFFSGAVFAVLALRVRVYDFASREQLREEWERYRKSPERLDYEVLGMLANQLISPAAGKSAIDALAEDLDHRGTRVRVAIWAVLVGLGLVALVAVILLIEVSVR